MERMEEELRCSPHAGEVRMMAATTAMRKEQPLQPSWHAHMHGPDEWQLARTACPHAPPVAACDVPYISRPITQI